MPTYEASDRFKRQFARLSPDEQAAFMVAVGRFVHDLKRGHFRKSLRTTRGKRSRDEREMTWAPDGRADFTYGPPRRPGDRHVDWQRIGTLDILDEA